MIQLTVNGVQHTLDIDPSTPLLYVLRNDLQLHGAKFGCGLGQCGACTVIVGERAVFSCLLPVSAISNRAVRTIEDLGTIDHPGPLQKAFIEHQAAQCGYCIAGMVMRAQALLDRTPHPTETQLRQQMEPNLCRCGTHMRIMAAIRQVAGLTKPAEANVPGGAKTNVAANSSVNASVNLVATATTGTAAPGAQQ